MRRKFLLGLSVVLGLLGAWTAISGGMQLRGGFAAQDWPSVKGQVMTGEARNSASKGLGSYWLFITYRYAVNGAVYHSTRVRTIGRNDFKGRIEEKVRRFAPGTPIDVFYDPANPSSAYVNGGVSIAGCLTPLLGFGLFCISVIGLRSVLNRKPDRATEPSLSAGGST